MSEPSAKEMADFVPENILVTGGAGEFSFHEGVKTCCKLTTFDCELPFVSYRL